MSLSRAQTRVLMLEVRNAKAAALDMLSFKVLRGSREFDEALEAIDVNHLVSVLETKVGGLPDSAERNECIAALNALNATCQAVTRAVEEAAREVNIPEQRENLKREAHLREYLESEPYVYLTDERIKELKSIFDEAEKE